MTPAQSSTPPRTGPARAVLLGVLVLAVLAALGWLAVGVVDRYVRNDAADRQEAREAVMLRAREYVDAAWNYSARDLDEQDKLTAYQQRVEPLITTDFATEFEKTLPVLTQLVAQEGFARSTTVDQLGVQTIDDNSAEVIVHGEITESQGKNKLAPTPFFWELNLQKVDGVWRVSDLGGFQGDT